MFIDLFEKTAAWQNGSSKPFPKGIVEQARQAYNKRVLEKGLIKATPTDTAKMKFVHVDQGVLKKLLAKGT